MMNWKKIILYAAIGACIASWIAVGAGFAFDVEKTIFLFIVTGAAIATEALFWAVAIVFGISVFESRKKIGNWLKSNLRPTRNHIS